MKSRAERLKLQNKLLELLNEVRDEVMALPNVVDVAIGLKETNGELTEDIVFQIFVKEKVASSDLDTSEIIPKEIKGFPTDVVKVPEAVNREDSSEHRPVTGGVQISNGKGHVGTLGCFARLKSDNSLVMLSNEHVIYSDGAVAGEKIGQPNIDDKCCCCCAYVDGIVGTILSPSFNNGTVDCAIASLDTSITPDHILHNAMQNDELHMDGIDVAVVGDAVRKIGRTSGLTNGTVTSINGPTARRNGQIFIRPAAGETYRESTNNKLAFSDGGDSGSIIINASNMVIGLLWGGDPNNFPVDETYANHINDVLNAFKNGGSEIELVKTPDDRSALAKNFHISPQRMNMDLRSRMLETEKGKLLVNLFELYQHEVLKLINNNRPVKVAWHRLQGPTFTAHIAKSYRDKDYIIPQAINNITLQELLIKMAQVIKTSCSESLREAIDKHALMLINDTYQVKTLEEYIQKVLSAEAVVY